MRRRTDLGYSATEEKTYGFTCSIVTALGVWFIAAIPALLSVIYTGVKRSIMPSATHSEDSRVGQVDKSDINTKLHIQLQIYQNTKNQTTAKKKH